jgi:hypothetical protein
MSFRVRLRVKAHHDLLIGAEAIALFVYGRADAKQVRDIYRNVLRLSLFKHGNSIAASKNVLVQEILALSAPKRREHSL